MNDSAFQCEYSLKDILMFTYKTDPQYLYSVVITYILSILSVLLNIYIFCTFASEKSLQKRHYIFTVVLTVSDLLFASTALVAVSVGHSISDNGLLVLSTLRTSSVMASFQTLEAIAVERLFVIVLYPLNKNINSPARLFSASALIWIISLSVAGILHFSNGQDWLLVIVPAWNVAILLLLTITYIVIYQAIYKHEKRIAGHRSQELKLSKSLLKTFSIIICSCIICWVPADILSFIDVFLFKDYCTEGYFVDIHAMGFNMALAYSLINPLVYGRGILELRYVNRKRMKNMCNTCRN